MIQFRILGPLEALDGGRPIALGGSRQRALLGLLLVHANEALSSERLIEELWGGRPPAAAAKTLQVTISRLRKALASDHVVTREHGYELRLDPEQLDAHRFEALLAEGRNALAGGRAERAATTLQEALSLWRGRPLDDLAYEPFAEREIARLEDLRAAALEQLIEAKLALGRHAEVIGELQTLVREHPYRERLRAQLMLALYRCDRQADALQAYQDARRTLVDELGIEPGERLRELERAVLAQDPALAAPAPPAGAEPPPPRAEDARPGRRLLSVVVADIVGAARLAEALDPEAMHALLDRFSVACSTVIERHGGTVEGYMGDAVAGVFGQAEMHEDDALRAVRAAVELRGAVAALSAELERDRGLRLGVKLGIEAGEAFVGAGARRATFAAGGAFAVAAGLEGIAQDGEIVLGEHVLALVRGAVRAEPIEPLVLAGRTAAVPAWRLVELDPEAPAIARSTAIPFVDRRRELDELRTAFARARDGGALVVATVVGPAGMGKSRLARELIADIGDAATVLTGRCAAYGEGVTYRPLAEIVRELGDGDVPRRVAELLDGDEPTAGMVLAAIGMSDGAVQREEMFWAVRKLFERLAQERPLVLVVDDLHWAEPSFLDLLDHVIALSSGHPLLLVCLTRPELWETRPAWGSPRGGAALLALDALPDAEARELVAHAGGAGLATSTAAQIVETAEGNPLFLEHLVAVGADGGEAELPSSIQAVLAARIDRLEPGERTLLELASVQGRSFYAGAVEEQLDAVPAAGLVALVQKQLIAPERSELPGEDAFRFAHVLIREAAYRGLPKQRRAELHEHTARWLEARARAEPGLVGYHLAEAYRHRAELGPVGPPERALAAAAAERLKAAADAALLRGDAPAGARLLERVASLLEPDAAARAELLPELGAALLEAGRLTDAAEVLDEAIARAPEPRLRARAQVERELVRLETDTSVGTEPARRAANAAVPVLEGAGDEQGLCRAWLLRGLPALNAGRLADADAAWSKAADCARRAGGRRELFDVIGWRALVAALGPTPVGDAIARCEAFRELVRASPIATALTLNPLALLHTMAGRFELAEALLAEAAGIHDELGGLVSGVSHPEAFAWLLAGRPAIAEARLRADVETLSAMSDRSALATSTALLAQAVYAQGRLDEASELCRMTERTAAEADVMSQAIWRGVQAKALACAGRGEEAEALARAAVALLEPTDLLSLRGDAMLDLAAVLRVADRVDDADQATRAGLALYELKGNDAAAGRARRDR